MKAMFFVGLFLAISSAHADKCGYESFRAREDYKLELRLKGPCKVDSSNEAEDGYVKKRLKENRCPIETYLHPNDVQAEPDIESMDSDEYEEIYGRKKFEKVKDCKVSKLHEATKFMADKEDINLKLSAVQKDMILFLASINRSEPFEVEALEKKAKLLKTHKVKGLKSRSIEVEAKELSKDICVNVTHKEKYGDYKIIIKLSNPAQEKLDIKKAVEAYHNPLTLEKYLVKYERENCVIAENPGNDTSGRTTPDTNNSHQAPVNQQKTPGGKQF